MLLRKFLNLERIAKACVLYFIATTVSLVLTMFTLGQQRGMLMGLAFDVVIWGLVIKTGNMFLRSILVLKVLMSIGVMLAMEGTDGTLWFCVKIFFTLYLGAIIVLIVWPRPKPKQLESM